MVGHGGSELSKAKLTSLLRISFLTSYNL